MSCSVISNSIPILKSISVTLDRDDYGMVSCTPDKIQNELLDQVSVVGRYQAIVIWFNKSISVKAVVGEFYRAFLLSNFLLLH